MLKRIAFEDGNGELLSIHDCDAEGCDVSFDGESITGHIITWTDPVTEKSGALTLKPGDLMPALMRIDPKDLNPRKANRTIIPLEARHTIQVLPLEIRTGSYVVDTVKPVDYTLRV